ncbi:hypothetical protein PF010_g20568 [Phytophthora fragariae]|nr:hypothetical protein PF003_g22169 [Phytophthora fragariae]KAE8929315.1 hypothetical protein PF009_g20567 [Phytophthora fragariae]KAE8986930.1 hypothetical protein PF011_g19786 [Phytophthora fragariae]KAE9083953.1 hypothetical protein PF007_g21695 [Phytophthora fragariae]KAE9085137.1 hypothetical protein PF010_g20568 [Phytophthora fragariae]
MSATIAAIYTGCQFVAALVIGFPVPFSYLTLNLVWLSLIITCLWIYMGAGCRRSQVIRLQLKRHGIFAYAVTSLAVVYPLFYYAFLCAGEYTGAQLVLSTVALPLIKMTEKQLLYHVTRHAPDLQPAFVAFDVEVFNALFVSSCMRTATSLPVTISLMVADFLGACIALYGLRNLMLRVDELSVKLGAGITRAHMIDIAVLIVNHHHPDSLMPRPSDRQATSSFIDNHKNSSFDAVHGAENSFSDPPRSPSKPAWGKNSVPLKQSSVAPAESAGICPTSQLSCNEEVSVVAIKQLPLDDKQQFVRETCRVLRRVEFLLLVEYTEVMVPFVYVIYIATVYNFPNRKYFPHLDGMSEAALLSTIRSLLIYCSLQLLSFVLLLTVLRRRYHLTSGSILSFVLKTDWRIVQGLLVLWIIYVLQSSLQHVGTDYTFKFQWLHAHDNK